MDYSIYPQYPFSVQFFSRGCIRHCPFCLVHDKEGHIQSVTPHDINPNGKWIEILDNNFFANPNWRDAAEYLMKLNQPVNFHGVDVRIMDEEQDLFRVRILKEMGIVPFAQAYRDFENKRQPTQYEKDFCRWVDNRILFKSMDFMDFEPRKGFKCSSYYE